MLRLCALQHCDSRSGNRGRIITCTLHPSASIYERADITSDQYNDWQTKNIYLNVQGVIHAEEIIETFKEYPPSQAPASFTVDPDVVLKMLRAQQAALGD